MCSPASKRPRLKVIISEVCLGVLPPSRLLTNFNVAFVPEEDGTNLISQTTEHFTLGLAPLNLMLTERN